MPTADYDATYWDNHTSDGRCKYPKTCEAGEGGHPADYDAHAEYLLEADQGHLEVTHEPCGERLLLTLHVHLDTLTRLAREHECRVLPPEVG